MLRDHGVEASAVFRDHMLRKHCAAASTTRNTRRTAYDLGCRGLPFAPLTVFPSRGTSEPRDAIRPSADTPGTDDAAL